MARGTPFPSEIGFLLTSVSWLLTVIPAPRLPRGRDLLFLLVTHHLPLVTAFFWRSSPTPYSPFPTPPPLLPQRERRLELRPQVNQESQGSGRRLPRIYSGYA